MPKSRIDQAYLNSLGNLKDKRKLDHYDTEIKGFVYEQRISGSGTFYLRYHNIHGVLKQHRIGGREDISCHEARKAAQRLRSNVVLGGDPMAAKAEKKAVPLYSDLAEQHLAFAKTHQRCPENTERVLRCHITPRWGKMRLDEIRQQDVAKWLAAKADEGLAPATVAKIKTVFHRSFELAQKWEMGGVTRNPLKGIPLRPLNNVRERFLTAEEAERLILAAKASANPLLAPLIQLYLYTGCRKSELLSAQWQHVSIERRTLYLPSTKTRPRHAPLSSAAIEVIEALPKKDSVPWLFAGKDGKRLTSFKRSWATVIREAKLPGLRIHDLRHSAASFMINGGIDLYAVGKVLGHADIRSASRYSHVNNETLLAAVEAGAAKLSVDLA